MYVLNTVKYSGQKHTDWSVLIIASHHPIRHITRDITGIENIAISLFQYSLFARQLLWVLPVLEWHPNENVQCTVIWVWIIFLSMSLMFTHLAAYISHAYLPIMVWYFHCINKSHSYAHGDSGFSSLIQIFFQQYKYCWWTFMNQSLDGQFFSISLTVLS